MFSAHRFFQTVRPNDAIWGRVFDEIIVSLPKNYPKLVTAYILRTAIEVEPCSSFKNIENENYGCILLNYRKHFFKRNAEMVQSDLVAFVLDHCIIARDHDGDVVDIRATNEYPFRVLGIEIVWLKKGTPENRGTFFTFRRDVFDSFP